MSTGRLSNSCDNSSRIRISNVRITRHTVSGNHGITINVRIVDIEKSVVCVIRVKSRAQ